MRVSRALTVAAVVVGVAACGSSTTDAKAPSSTTTKPTATTSTTSSPVAGRPTQWHDDTAHWQQLAPDPFDLGPTAIADELAARYRGGDTSEVGQVSVAEVRTGEPLVVVLREQGVSDGILDRTIEITLEGGDRGWKVVSARVRDGCVEVAESDPTHCV
jgi:hypothetical protein